ncbi:MAG: SRPBCC domain-containing protein [Planctomycetaceae bacterium]|nr:SRPBCC domain-containing protein [Planctomycetaceae bacterium]
MNIDCTADFPVTDAECKKVTGRTLTQWFSVIDERDDLKSKRRDCINWIYEDVGMTNVWWPTTIWVEYERFKGIVNKKDGRIEGFNICATKTINAPPADVYAAWTTPALLRKWFGSKSKATVENGGAFSDGDGNSGTFLRVREKKDLRFTWIQPGAEAPTQVDVVFSDKGKNKTGLMLNHQRIQNRNEADGLRRAWGECFDRLKSLLEE